MFKKEKTFIFKYSSRILRDYTRSTFFKLKKKRKTTCFFQFDDYLRVAPSYIKKTNLRFLEWFVGFTEGDGCFCVRKGWNEKPRLVFEICQKDPKVLFLIKKTLGFGYVTISKRKSGKYWVYKVYSKKNIQKIIRLFNGNLVLTKRKVQFEKWLKAAKLWKCLPSPFQKKNFSRFVTVSRKTAWLSGFIDAEGCFYATLSTPSLRSKLTRSLKQKFHLTQKNVYDEKRTPSKNWNLFQIKSKSYKNIFKRKTKKELQIIQNTFVLKSAH